MLRSEQAERTRAALLDAAAMVFEQRGFDAARIQEFLDRAGVTKGAMYHHFTTKLEVAQALAADGERRWRDLLATGDDGERGLDALRTLWHAIAIAVHESVELRAYLRIAAEIGIPDARSPFAALQREVVTRLQQAIADRVISDRIDTHQVSISLIDTVYGVLTSPAPWSREDDLEERLSGLWALVSPGLVTLA